MRRALPVALAFVLAAAGCQSSAPLKRSDAPGPPSPLKWRDLPAAPARPVRAVEVPTGSPHRLIGLDAAGEAVWAAGARGAWARSLDGGQTWTHGTVPGADTLQFRDVHAADGRRAVVLSIGPGTASRVYATDDGGQTWTLRWTNPDPRAFYDCMAFDGPRGYAVSDAVATSDTTAALPLAETLDGGLSWRVLPEAQWPRARPGVGLFASSGTCALLSGPDLFLATHHADGVGASRVSWHRQEPAGRQSYASRLPLSSTDPMRGVATLVLRSEQGRTALYAGLLGAVDSVTVFRTELRAARGAATRSAVHPTRDDAWQALPPLPLARVYGLAASAAALVATGPDGLAVSTTSGTSWQQVSARDLWSAMRVDERTFVAVGAGGLALRLIVE